MGKKTSGKSKAEKGKARRKLADLAPKRVKGGDAASIKGGITNVAHDKWIQVTTLNTGLIRV